MIALNEIPNGGDLGHRWTTSEMARVGHVSEHVQAIHGLAAVEVPRATIYRCRCAAGGVTLTM